MAVAMGSTAGLMGSSPSRASPASAAARGRRRGVVFTAAMGGLTDQYRTLRLPLGASEKEVKQAFRKLALQYHPDVCKGNNCGVQFQQINEAYDIVMNSLRSCSEVDEYTTADDVQFRGTMNENWDLWEEWMGWEGAGTLDYSSHINPYI